ncbi:MAG: class I SAM-dependent methyltransferase [Gemmataceae bacterium]|nr:class I SAM-dependent methyltransferase [Gemmataceae bacterium]
MTPPVNTYDEMPYDSHPYAQTHPSRLAVIATLFGLSPPPVETARVLELGAAAGGNIIPVGEAFPRARLVGVDNSARQVEDGRKWVAAAGVGNVELKLASILDIDAGYGEFDYVIAHGVFSWVPTEVREKILDVCAKHLAPNGVAYVSYNTYPGWHMRGMIRDMMQYHSRRFAAPKEQIGQARALLDFLASSCRQEGPYPALLKSELESVKNQADHYLYHEHLEQVNDPVYFHQFVEMAGRHGLRFLGEARVGTMVTGNFGPDVEKALKRVATDQIQTEQYMDFLRNRMFRETLLVHRDRVPNWTIKPESIHGLHVASSGKPVGPGEPDITSEATVQYKTRTGMTLSTGRPLLKAAMAVLGRRWPETVPFAELLREARGLLGGPADPADAQNLALGLTNTYISSDLVELHAAPVLFARTPGEKPEAVRSARVRVADGGKAVANRRHELVKLTDLDLRLVPLLDGTRTRPELIEALTAKALAGELHVQRDGKPLAAAEDIRAALTAVLDQALKNLASQALLVN